MFNCRQKMHHSIIEHYISKYELHIALMLLTWNICKLDTLNHILETLIHTISLEINILMYQCTNVPMF